MKICVPIVGQSRAQALRDIEKGVNLADMLELRMDLIARGTDLRELMETARSSSHRCGILVTNRTAGEGGGRACSEEQRVALLKEAVELGADYVDVELGTEPRLRNELREAVEARKKRTQLIVSYHNFGKTPSLQALREIVNDSIDAGAAIVKIATFARHQEDNLRVLQMIPFARRKSVGALAFCMGEKGKVSRIVAPLLGAPFTFASLSRVSASAAGQLTVEDTNRIFEIVRSWE
ncbi:MAG: type I 3-dehydroquinate dehydratase [Smithellaceae bacterium]|nr:type I 3-dehydroquinate dehydratase [Smithellaceae bacterium]